MLLARGAGEPGEPLGELRAGFGLAACEVCGDFTHGQQRSGRGGVLGEHRVGQYVNLLALDLAVLELAEAILELLEVADDLLIRDRIVQREEIHSLADAMLAERAAPAATLLAMGEIAANLAHSQAEARAEFAQRFARFAGPAGQQHMRALLDRPLSSSAPAGAGQ